MLLLIIITVVKSIIICMRLKNNFPPFHVRQVYLRDLHLLEHLNRKMLRRTKVIYNSNPNTNTNTDNLNTITNSNIFSNLQAANVNRSLLGGIKVTAANTEVWKSISLLLRTVIFGSKKHNKIIRTSVTTDKSFSHIFDIKNTNQQSSLTWGRTNHPAGEAKRVVAENRSRRPVVVLVRDVPDERLHVQLKSEPEWFPHSQ